jgi:hypothetical protein
MKYDKEFYVADSFDRNGAMYYMSEPDSTITCANSVNWCDSAISAQGTSSKTYGSKGISALTSSFDTVSSVTTELSANMNRIVNTLKELGSRLGVDINDIGDITRTPKMNFKMESVNRLRRRDLLTLKGN